MLTDATVEEIERLIDEHGDLKQALEGLPVDQREAVRGRVLEDRSYQGWRCRCNARRASCGSA